LGESQRQSEPGSFSWCVNMLDLGDPVLTAVAKVVCRQWTVWPEQLLGRELAGTATSSPDNPPLSTGLIFRPSRLGYVVLARRMAWNLTHRRTGKKATEIGAVLGGYSPATVRPWLGGSKAFDKSYGWSFRAGDYIEELDVLVTLELS